MDSVKLTNAEFTLTIGDRDFQVKKANLEKAILYQAKVRELIEKKNAHSDLNLVSYCTWLIVKDADPTVSEGWVRENLPADVAPVLLLQQLGFMSQQKVEQAQKITDSLAEKTPEEKKSE
jgi:hypothetical protein